MNLLARTDAYVSELVEQLVFALYRDGDFN
jgi:hypothetical protein